MILRIKNYFANMTLYQCLGFLIELDKAAQSENIKVSMLGYFEFGSSKFSVIEAMSKLEPLSRMDQVEIQFDIEQQGVFSEFIQPIIDKYENISLMFVKAKTRPVVILTSINDGPGRENSERYFHRALAMGYGTHSIPLAESITERIELVPTKKVMDEIHSIKPLSIFVHDGVLNHFKSSHTNYIASEIAKVFPECPVYFENSDIMYNTNFRNQELDELFNSLFAKN